MDLPFSAAGLSFALCAIIVALGSLLIWAIWTVDRWLQPPVPADRWTVP